MKFSEIDIFRMNRQRKQKIRDIQSDDELSESGPEISDAEDYAEGRILIPDIYGRFPGN